MINKQKKRVCNNYDRVQAEESPTGKIESEVKAQVESSLNDLNEGKKKKLIFMNN